MTEQEEKYLLQEREDETEHIRSMGEAVPVEAEEKNTEEIVLDAEELSPFGDEKVWKRISLEEMVLFSEVPLGWKKEFFFLLPYRKYHHLILQEQEDGIWLGVPGQFQKEDAADAHAFGFHEFRNTAGNWGYWLAFLQRSS